MKPADRIREFAFQKFIKPARQRGEGTVTIRAGDVHSMMGLSDRIPAVCSALGTNKFQETYQVRLTGRRGPTNASNAFFTFEV